jgi:hypothetical protein
VILQQCLGRKHACHFKYNKETTESNFCRTNKVEQNERVVVDRLGTDRLMQRIASTLNPPRIEIVTCDASAYMITVELQLKCPAVIQRAKNQRAENLIQPGCSSISPRLGSARLMSLPG